MIKKLAQNALILRRPPIILEMMLRTCCSKTTTLLATVLHILSMHVILASLDVEETGRVEMSYVVGLIGDDITNMSREDASKAIKTRSELFYIFNNACLDASSPENKDKARIVVSFIDSDPDSKILKMIFLIDTRVSVNKRKSAPDCDSENNLRVPLFYDKKRFKDGLENTFRCKVFRGVDVEIALPDKDPRCLLVNATFSFTIVMPKVEMFYSVGFIGGSTINMSKEDAEKTIKTSDTRSKLFYFFNNAFQLRNSVDKVIRIVFTNYNPDSKVLKMKLWVDISGMAFKEIVPGCESQNFFHVPLFYIKEEFVEDDLREIFRRKMFKMIDAKITKKSRRYFFVDGSFSANHT